MSLVTGLFCLVLHSNQRWSPPLRLQASHCSTFRIMCDVPSIAVFCCESIECFPGTASRFFFRLLVTIPVAPIITDYYYYYYIFWVCVYIRALVTQHALRMRCIILSSVVCLVLPYFSALSCKRYDFQKNKKVIEHKTRVLISSTAFVWDIPRSKKNSARYYQNCKLVFM